MQLARFLQATDWSAPGAVYSAAYLDAAVNVSSYGHPAVVGTVPVTSTLSFGGAQAFTGSPALPSDVHSSTFSSGDWAQVDVATLTTKAGGTYSFSTTARQVTLSFAGIVAAGVGFTAGGINLVAGAIRNGAVATVSVDGVVQATVDTYGAAPRVTLYLDGTRRTILITHTGGYNTAIHPLTPVSPLVGTSVSNGLSVSVLYHATLVQATWRVLATDSSHYSLYKTPPGGSETLVASGLLVGTTYADSAHVPGVSLVLTGTLITSDSATFATDVTQVALTSVLLGYSAGGSGGITYTSPVIDAGDAATAWFTAEWTQGNVPALSLFTFQTGQTPTPDDGTWATTYVTPQNIVLPDALTPMGVAGLQTVPRGRYARFIATFAIGTASVAFLRDLQVASWVPERDPQFLSKMAFGENWAPGLYMTAFFGALSVELAATRQEALDYVAAFGIAGAVDQYLQAYGADYGLPQYTGEQQTTYRQRLLAARRSQPGGGSLGFVAQEVALLTGFPVSSLGAVATGSYAFTLTIPPPVSSSTGTIYPNLPGLSVPQAQSIITAFVVAITPATNIPTVVFS